MKQRKRLALLVTITDRGYGNKLTDLYTRNQVFTHLRCEGSGTATSEILDILGLGSSEKDILLSLAPVATIRALLDALEDDLHEAVPGRGIAFTAPLDAMSNLMAAFIAARTKLEKEEPQAMEQKSSLILVAMNQGFTDVVMDTARKAGARGGTAVRGRWVGEENFAPLQGVARQGEKDILAIVVPRELRGPVMEAINRDHGLQSDAGALVLSMGIDRLIHLG